MQFVDRALRAVRPYREIILFTLLLGAVLWLRLSLPDLITVRRIQAWIVVGPDAWPRFLINASILCLGGLLIMSIVEYRRKSRRDDVEGGADAADLMRWLAIVLLIAIYIYTVGYAGYIVLTFVFGIIYCLLVGLRRPAEYLGLPTAFLMVSLLLFTQLLSVPLPRGSGFIRQLSYYIY